MLEANRYEHSPTLAPLADLAFACADIVHAGIVREIQHASDAALTFIFDGDTEIRFKPAKDERKAPYACQADGTEDCNLLISCTDEKDLRVIAYAQPAHGSALFGLGVDLCALDDFQNTPSNRRFFPWIFSENECSLIGKAQTEHEAALVRAHLFSAKEAAFKATSQPLRRYYDGCDEELRFTVRNFESSAGGQAKAIGSAEDALDRLQIDRIDLHQIVAHGMVATTATAYRRERAT